MQYFAEELGSRRHSCAAAPTLNSVGAHPTRRSDPQVPPSRGDEEAVMQYFAERLGSRGDPCRTRLAARAAAFLRE